MIRRAVRVEYWAEGNYVAMYDMASTKSRKGSPRSDSSPGTGSFGRGRRSSIEQSDAEGGETNAEIPMEVDTLAFGTIDQSLKVTFGSGRNRLAEQPALPRARTERRADQGRKLPGRAKILAEDGQVMAEGPVDAREHPLGDSMIDVTGVTGPPDQEGARI